MREVSYGGYQAKHSKQGYSCYADLNQQPLQEFLEIRYSPVPDTERKTPIQMEISFANVNVFYKWIVSVGFQSCSCLFLKNNQPKIVLWHILFPFNPKISKYQI